MGGDGVVAAAAQDVDVGVVVEVGLGGGEGVKPGDEIVFYEVMMVGFEVGEISVRGGAKGVSFYVLLLLGGEVV